MQLETIQKFVDEVNETNSILDKKFVIKKYPELKKLFKYVYSPYITFGVTSANCIKNDYLTSDETYTDIFILLDKLAARELTGHNALLAVNSFVAHNSKYEELIYNIIDKNLKARIDASIINDVLDDAVPVFSVALAKKYDDFKHKIDFTHESWFASRKLDGLRCIAIRKVDGYHLYSRTGKEFFTLDKIRQALNETNSTAVFDGEICLIDENGIENFPAIMKEYSRKNHTIERPRYNIFDMLTYDDFANGASECTFSARLDAMADFICTLKPTSYLTFIEQHYIETEEQLDSMMEKAVASGWEGLILRRDAFYKGKRSADLLKLKEMHDAEYEVIGYEIGPMRIIVDGHEIEINTLTNIMIKHKGYSVSVGSGFTIDERQFYASNPEAIVGKTVTIKYFEETKNDKGGISLRFPIFKGIREGA